MGNKQTGKYIMGNLKKLPTSDNQKFEETVYDLLGFLGENPNREGLLDTPRRVRESLQFLTSGYKEDPIKVLNSALFESDNKEMVLVKDIEFNSLCEHHMLPFSGVCHVAYIPNGKIVGLSKISRLVDIFSRRLQVQERLVDDIAMNLSEAVGARGVAVMTKAKHMCMQMRGVEKCMPSTQCSSYLGDFLSNYNLKQEFLMSIS